MLIVYKIRQNYIKYEISQILKDKNASYEKLTLTLAQYQKSQINSKEIYFKGNMYDVKSVDISGDIVVLLVLNDKKENNLLEEVRDFSKKTNPQNRALPYQIISLLSLNYVHQEANRFCFIPCIIISSNQLQNADILSNCLDTPYPPPKLV